MAAAITRRGAPGVPAARPAVVARKQLAAMAISAHAAYFATGVHVARVAVGAENRHAAAIGLATSGRRLVCQTRKLEIDVLRARDRIGPLIEEANRVALSSKAPPREQAQASRRADT